MLRIKNFLLPDVDVLSFDFTLISELKKESPNYKKGRKVKSTYTYNDTVVVEKVFEDVLDENGVLSAINMTINWYNEDDTIGLSKIQEVKHFNKVEIKTELRKRRARSIDFLLGFAEGTPIEPYLNAMFKHYKTDIDLFIYNNEPDFKNDILNESDEQFVGFLNMVIEAPSEKYPSGKTVKDAILEQL